MHWACPSTSGAYRLLPLPEGPETFHLQEEAEGGEEEQG